MEQQIFENSEFGAGSNFCGGGRENTVLWE